MSVERDEELVEGRTCGNCVVCCYALPIDTPELRKLPGVVCANCSGKGCAIYDARPQVCRGFYCGWRLLSIFDDSWRPDRSGILVTPEKQDIPAEFELRDGIEFLVLGGRDAVTRPGVAEMIMLFVRREVPTFISVNGPEGTFPAKTLVNAHFKEAARRSDRQAALRLLVGLVDAAEKLEFRKAELNGPAGR